MAQAVGCGVLQSMLFDKFVHPVVDGVGVDGSAIRFDE